MSVCVCARIHSLLVLGLIRRPYSASPKRPALHLTNHDMTLERTGFNQHGCVCVCLGVFIVCPCVGVVCSLSLAFIH